VRLDLAASSAHEDADRVCIGNTTAAASERLRQERRDERCAATCTT
jgi:hypothetical protein